MGNSFRPTYRGQTANPTFYKTSESIQYKQPNSNKDALGRIELPIIIIGTGLVLFGVIVLSMGHRQVVHTAPLVQVMPSYSADEAIITNEIGTIHALSAMKELASTAQTPPS